MEELGADSDSRERFFFPSTGSIAGKQELTNLTSITVKRQIVLVLPFSLQKSTSCHEVDIHLTFICFGSLFSRKKYILDKSADVDDTP